MLKLADSRNRRLLSEAKQQDIELNANTQAEAAQAKHQMDLDLEKAKQGNIIVEKEQERKTLVLQHSLAMDRLVKENTLEAAEKAKERDSVEERDLVKILAQIA